LKVGGGEGELQWATEDAKVKQRAQGERITESIKSSGGGIVM